MKKMYLIESSLQSRGEARMDFGQELNIAKISREEALAFDGRFKTADEMFAHYGYSRRLRAGEHYEGYIAIWYEGAPYLQTSAWMYGSLRKATRYEVCNARESYVRDAAERGAYWVLEHEKRNGIPVVGAVRNFSNFQQCLYADAIRKWQKDPDKLFDWAREIKNPELLERELKKKILDGAISKTPSEITEDEYLVLQHFHGKETLKKFFSVI